ncbi:hypothetical protein PRIC1_015090 [Phytophthora ramorum]|uniref:Uncharacterized protein n=1 Tax=Phytophthora ramorum TaxID=164328 RepID=H3GML4_PHYRM|nr:hypothetical protein KRP23_8091 [Phytophthora ramorum]KAH7495206.1 hypothetical protein KRP22_14824 [Phytophthora ramorum]
MDASGGLGDVHSNGGDIDSLLSSDADVEGKMRRLQEPYERHRAHDLRAECYRRGLRPIKKGPNANDNKSGYIDLLRKFDGTSQNGPPNGLPPLREDQMGKRGQDEAQDDDDSNTGDTDPQIVNNMANKRKLPTMTIQTQTQNDNGELQGFYEGAQSGLVLPMQYPPNLKSSTNPTTDLEILSGIANSYTQNVAADGQLCGSCRTVVTEQLMESIRLGKTKMQLQEWHKMTEQRDRDTHHLKEVLEVLQELRRAFREAQTTGMNHELLVELQDDMAFFRNLKERTKERMRQAMQEARERGNKPNATA